MSPCSSFFSEWKVKRFTTTFVFFFFFFFFPFRLPRTHSASWSETGGRWSGPPSNHPPTKPSTHRLCPIVQRGRGPGALHSRDVHSPTELYTIRVHYTAGPCRRHSLTCQSVSCNSDWQVCQPIRQLESCGKAEHFGECMYINELRIHYTQLYTEMLFCLFIYYDYLFLLLIIIIIMMSFFRDSWVWMWFLSFSSEQVRASPIDPW